MSYNKKDKTYNGYIYLITNVVNSMKYVGLTSTTVNARWRRHVNITKQRAEKDFCLIDMMIKEFGSENFIVETLAWITSDNEKDLWDDMNRLEKEYIIQYESLWNNGYGKGYNVDEGGNAGTINYKPTDAYTIKGEFIATFKSRQEAADYFDINDQTVGNICIGRTSSYKSKYVFRDKGDAFNKYDITNHSMYRKYYQFDLDGNFIAYYNSCQEIPYDFKWRIWEVVDNPYKTCGGFWWATEKQFNYQGNQTYKTVDMYTTSGVYIETFKSISACARQIDVSPSSIGECCKGETKTVKGFVFRYSGDAFNLYDISKKQRVDSRKINKYSLDDIYIDTYNSLTEAGKSVNAKTISGIMSCCSHKEGHKTYYKYKWFYADDITQPDKTKIIID